MILAFFDWFYKVLIIQTICVLIILSAVVVMKYFFKGQFSKIAEFYNQNIMADTYIAEVLEDAV